MYLYFLVDTSGSMDGAKIQSVNDTMENIISELKLHSDNLDMFINVLSFARKSKWMFNQPVNIRDFSWNVLIAGGMTSLGDACKQLAENIVQNINQDEVSIVLLSDGVPTDDFDEGLEELDKSLSNKNAKLYAIALEGADINTMNKFTGNADNVFQLESLDNLFEQILSTIDIFSKTIHYSNIDNADDDWA